MERGDWATLSMMLRYVDELEEDDAFAHKGDNVTDIVIRGKVSGGTTKAALQEVITRQSAMLVEKDDIIRRLIAYMRTQGIDVSSFRMAPLPLAPGVEGGLPLARPVLETMTAESEAASAAGSSMGGIPRVEDGTACTSPLSVTICEGYSVRPSRSREKRSRALDVVGGVEEAATLHVRSTNYDAILSMRSLGSYVVARNASVRDHRV